MVESVVVREHIREERRRGDGKVKTEAGKRGRRRNGKEEQGRTAG